ncbi:MULTISPECIES: MerR family transcriptional regulator [unclassified Mycolicibacterium]|uniref:MerR family transcriptional regulator n=1 Tax=unclassified Mycolicibacterium TaxID=2636767 RepID=UPI002EDA9C0A
MTTRLAIGDLSRRCGVAQTTLRYYEQIGLIPPPERVGGQRRYPESVLVRLELIRLCKAAGFTLDEIGVLIGDETPGRPVAQSLAHAKLARIDEQLESLSRARAIIEWGMRCTCPSIDACTCGIHRALPI